MYNLFSGLKSLLGWFTETQQLEICLAYPLRPLDPDQRQLAAPDKAFQGSQRLIKIEVEKWFGTVSALIPVKARQSLGFVSYQTVEPGGGALRY